MYYVGNKSIVGDRSVVSYRVIYGRIKSFLKNIFALLQEIGALSVLYIDESK